MTGKTLPTSCNISKNKRGATHLPARQVGQLRCCCLAMSAEKYTLETVTWIKPWTDTLFSFRTTRSPDFRFVPGQFARLGVAIDDASAPDGSGQRIVWRAYSVVSASDEDFLEFYSVLVPTGEFTNAVAAMAPGDPLYVEKVPYGFLTTERFAPAKVLWMLSTGTGLGPFLSIARDPGALAQFDRLIVVNSVRHTAELSYRDVLADREPQVSYVPIVTRGAIAPMLADRIPHLISSGLLESATGVRFDPATSCVMLCGNPAMVDETRKLLTPLGFATSRRGAPGTLAVENYW